jgi:MFS family permease
MLRSVLTAPGVARVFGASLLGRIPAGALGLLLILRVGEVGGGYGGGGLAAGAFALGLAAAAPLVGRVVDVRGQTGVLAACTVAVSAALVALAVVPAGTPLVVLLALAGVAGAAHPPLAACLRALWPSLLADPARRHAAYALESAALEVSYLLGPLVLIGAIATSSAAAALAASAALLLAGTAAFAVTPASRAWTPVPGVRRGLAGALAGPGVRTLVSVQALAGVSFGAIEVATVAFAQDAGAKGAIGPLLAAWGLASMLGGAIAARGGAPHDPVRRLVVLLAALAAGDALLVAATGPLVLGALLVVAGLAIAPAFAVVYGLAGEVAREGTVTEAFTWLTTGLGAGLAAGSAVGGALAASAGPGAAFLAAAGAAALAAAVGAARARDLAAAPDVRPPAGVAAAAASPASPRAR